MEMDRRTFVKGFGGLVVFAAFAGASGLAVSEAKFPSTSGRSLLHTTPNILLNEQTVGPLMQAGIELRSDDELGIVSGFFENELLFNVNTVGATLITLATGALGVDDLAARASERLGHDVQPVDVARFFVVMGQSGFLQNVFQVNLYGMTSDDGDRAGIAESDNAPGFVTTQ